MTRVGAGTGKTTAELQSPTGYSGIFANWNRDLGTDRLPDNPWNFRTSSQYPILNTPGQRVIDYDGDDDGLIDVSSLLQLNAIRHDLNGDGVPTDTTAYAGAFPGGKLDGTASTLMGCTSGCSGYELTANLDFDTDGSGTVTSADAYPNWTPIGGSYAATFNGRGHTISNLTITSSSSNVGLFAQIATGGIVRDVGMIDASVSGPAGSIGILVGSNNGTITTSYIQGGSITGASGTTLNIGGMAGSNYGTIRAAYATASISSSRPNTLAGGLVGTGGGSGTIIASYAAGSVSGSGPSGSEYGGLVGRLIGSSTVITNSYFDTQASGRSSGVSAHFTGATANATGQTTAQLQSPTTYTGIYATWNLDLASDNYPDNPWNFGTSSQYPTLYTPGQREQVIDYDSDNDGLIDVNSLDQLNAIRYDLDGNGLPGSTGNYAAYAGAFPAGELATAATRMGCPGGTCTGYELTANLDFDTTGDGTVTAADAYPNWSPIGRDVQPFLTNRYSGDFNGNGHIINNLFMNLSGRSDAGLFGSIHNTSRIEDLGVTNANVTAANYTGILVGSSFGEVVACYTTGQVSGGLAVGGLIGYYNGVTVSTSYSTAAVTSSGEDVGGLVGHKEVENNGLIVNSYATGRVINTNIGGALSANHGNNMYPGGLTGYDHDATKVTDSYWDTSSSGASRSASGTGYTTAQLQSPTGYTGIYANWNIDLNGDDILDYPWNFGTSSQYPTLNTPAQRAIARIQVSISSESVPEGAAGTTTPLRFTVQLNRASTSQVRVAYTDAGTGSAESGTDYNALAGGTLTFAAGETRKIITISVIGDAVAEPDETVIVTLSNAVNATLGTVSATGTITNDDGASSEPEPDLDPTFTEAIDPQSYPQGNAIDPLALPEATDGTGTLTYALTPDLPAGLTFDAETLTVSGTPTEATEKAIYTLTVTDEDGDSAEVSFFLTISGNLIPSFGDASVDAQAYMRKQAIDALTLPQATGGDAPLTYALTPDLPSGLKFDAETRVLSGTPTEAMDETTYTLTATDSDGDEATLTFTLKVTTDPIPIFGDTTIVAQGYQHQAFAPLTLPQATGGDEPLTYALNPDPPLPEGLKFDGETLTVSGTPLKAMDETTYTLTATDGNGDEVHLMFTLEIPDLMPTFGSDTTIAAQSYLVNQEIESLTFPEASSGDGMLVYILLPSLPDGISFNPDTRTLSGMPTEEKDMATYTLSALDTDGDVASIPFTLEVSLPSPDFNGDGTVNFADFLTFAGKFGSRLGQERYDARCDLNGDSQINFDDFLKFAAAFGSSG